MPIRLSESISGFNLVQPSTNQKGKGMLDQVYIINVRFECKKSNIIYVRTKQQMK